MNTLIDAAQQYELGLQARKKGDNDLAVEYWMFAADHATTETARKIADGLSAIASSFFRAGKKLKVAETLYLRAIELRRQFLPVTDESLAIELNNLGMLYDKMNEKDKAINLLEDAIVILDEHSNLSREEYADPYCNLASLYFEVNRKVADLYRALVLCEKALKIRDKVLGPVNPFSLKSLELLADIEEAIKPHSRSAREARKEFDARYESLASRMNALGDPLMSETLEAANFFGRKQSRKYLSTSLDIVVNTALAARRRLA